MKSFDKQTTDIFGSEAETVDNDLTIQTIKQQNQVTSVKQFKQENTVSTNQYLEQFLVPEQRQTMTIFIKASWEAILLEVLNTDNIYDVKVMIQQQTGFPTSKQILTFQNLQLQDQHSLSMYNIQKFDQLDLKLDWGSRLSNQGGDFSDSYIHESSTILREVNVDKVPLQIYVQTITGVGQTLSILKTETIKTLKNEIADRTGFPVDQFILTMNQFDLIQGTLQGNKDRKWSSNLINLDSLRSYKDSDTYTKRFQIIHYGYAKRHNYSSKRQNL